MFPIVGDFLNAINGVLGKVVDRLDDSVIIFQCLSSFFLILWVEIEYVVRNTRGRGCLGGVGLLVGFGVGPVEVGVGLVVSVSGATFGVLSSILYM